MNPYISIASGGIGIIPVAVIAVTIVAIVVSDGIPIAII